MQLYKLSEDLQSIQETLEAIEGLEVPEDLIKEYEEFLEKASKTESEFANKVNAVACYIKNLKAMAKARREEGKRLTELARLDEKKVEFLNNYLMKHLILTDHKKVKGLNCEISVCQNAKKPVIIDEDLLMDEYPERYLKVEKRLNKAAIREDLEEGIELPFARLAEKPDYHLKIR